jgi:hypothetical protein
LALTKFLKPFSEEYAATAPCQEFLLLLNRDIWPSTAALNKEE